MGWLVAHCDARAWSMEMWARHFCRTLNGQWTILVVPKGATECTSRRLDRKEERGSSKTPMRGMEMGEFGARARVQREREGNFK